MFEDLKKKIDIENELGTGPKLPENPVVEEEKTPLDFNTKEIYSRAQLMQLLN